MKRYYQLTREQRYGIYTLLKTGHNQSEIAELLAPLFTWDNVDFENNVVKLFGKKQKITYIPMNMTLRRIFERRRDCQKNEVPFDMNYEYMFKKVKKYYQMAGIEDANIHTLRRTFGSLLSQNGVEIFRVSTLMGHSDVKVTSDHYASLTDENLTASVMILDDLIGHKE